MKYGTLLIALLLIVQVKATVKTQETIRVGVIGLTHTHVHWILGREGRGDIEIVGIVEPNRELAQRYADQHGYSMEIVYDTMDEMIAAKKPIAVTAFGTIYAHLEVVEKCAPLGIHVMVEKPLAVSLKHALLMRELAEEHGIHLLTNYETTWYPTNHKAKRLLKDGDIGSLRKVVVHDGHRGPFEIGVNDEFLEWLIDPIQNGGGALTDFGCYGANLITWLTDGQLPTYVLASTQTNKPKIYPEVDDEATIILQYQEMQGIIQASWNWPIARKDMEVYGKHGQIFADNRNSFRYQLDEEKPEVKEQLEELDAPYDDPFALFAAVIQNEIQLSKYDLSSLENNMIVMEILEAAKKSARTGKRVKLRN